ncbi:uncharacterized protein LOC119575899 [Penaeus monodon]|uniref:uncharacterized protein LOC119575899 n=1 Tax=Penaeus monodon TaxID=6687 RepID=UPI0018A6E0A3|nr:uncharacterized protein LOC119575899 [Penaeus monodon]
MVKISTQGYTQRPKCLDLSEDLLPWNGARRQFQRMGGDLVVPFDVAAIGAYAGVQADSYQALLPVSSWINEKDWQQDGLLVVTERKDTHDSRTSKNVCPCLPLIGNEYLYLSEDLLPWKAFRKSYHVAKKVVPRRLALKAFVFASIKGPGVWVGDTDKGSEGVWA